MVSINLFEFVKRHLEQIDAFHAPLKFGGLSSNAESTAFKYIPSNSGQEYYDKTRNIELGFQLLSKSESQVTAVNSLDAAENALYLSNVAIDDVYFIVAIRPYTQLHEVEVTEKREHIYTMLYNVEIEKMEV